jgi:hypothetical protein
MTTMIFRQGGNNTRIGNSFYWVENARNWCQRNNVEFCFITGQDIFSPIFENSQLFFKKPKTMGDATIFDYSDTYSAFLGRITQSVNSVSIKKSMLRIYEIFPKFLVHVQAGAVNWDESDELKALIGKYEYVVVEEPYPFKCSLPNLDTLTPSEDISRLLSAKRISSRISIHVRQGDYEHWQNGKHYKDNVFYNELLQALLSHAGENLNYKLSVVHNGEFNLLKNLGDKIELIPDYGYDDHINDLLTLAMSDVVIGPMSTFSQLANDFRNRCGLSRFKLIVINKDITIDEIMKSINF